MPGSRITSFATWATVIIHLWYLVHTCYRIINLIFSLILPLHSACPVTADLILREQNKCKTPRKYGYPVPGNSTEHRVVCFNHINLIFPPMYIHHNRCPCCCLIEQDKLCGRKPKLRGRDTSIAIRAGVIWPCNANRSEYASEKLNYASQHSTPDYVLCSSTPNAYYTSITR